MITVSFLKSGSAYLGFSVSGHAGYAPYGEDIVCAGVSSAVQLTVNAITEILQIPAKVTAENDTVSLHIADRTSADAAQPFLKALLFHLQLLAEDYQGMITFI